MALTNASSTAAIRKLLDEYRPKGVKVDLGCGNYKQPGFLGIDAVEHPGVDIVHDLEVYPWPLPNDSCDLLLASHLVEHIDPARGGFIKFMDEAWRVLRVGGQFIISTPYAGSAGYWQDPTHINGCTEGTWAYFDPLEPTTGGHLWRDGYHPKPWQIAQNAWNISGNLEAVLVKRAEDESYG